MNPIALTILTGLIITAVAIAFDAYRNPVEDDPDELPEGDCFPVWSGDVSICGGLHHEPPINRKGP
jgi:hypothetical protein